MADLRTKVARVLPTILIAVLLVFAAFLGLQRKLIYFPDRDLPTVADVLPGAREVQFGTEDGLTLGGWLVPPHAQGPGYMVLVANGNAGNRADRARLASALADAGMAVLLFDYRGYGGNLGSPDEAGLTRDARAAYTYLTDTLDLRADQLIYLGESLGAAVVTRLAAEHPPAGLVLRSPFTSLADVGREHYPFLPVSLLLRDTYPVADTITKVKVPTTVVLGTADTVVPPAQSRAVAAAAGARVVEVQGADHNDPALTDGPQLIAAVTTLLG
ncbi:alpha/beta hydrolase [Actinocrispum sp. NPDC049592]|uniref:alpha/beta hydrolase n=1 Tax=Actinocrispum sp. NPDC049592 TaxID=3154835 RepID=UPI00342222B1